MSSKFYLSLDLFQICFKQQKACNNMIIHAIFYVPKKISSLPHADSKNSYCGRFVSPLVKCNHVEEAS